MLISTYRSDHFSFVLKIDEKKYFFLKNDFWHKIKEGKKEGLKDLYDTHFDALYSFGLYIHEDAERVQDAIHDLFIKLWDRRETITIPNNTRNYLFTALRNDLIQKVQKGSKVVLTESIQDQEDDAPFFEGDDDERKKKLKKAIETLSPKNREVIYLKYKDNLSNEEIAEVLGINNQSVRNLIHRAIKQLKKNIPNVSTFLLLYYL